MWHHLLLSAAQQYHICICTNEGLRAGYCLSTNQSSYHRVNSQWVECSLSHAHMFPASTYLAIAINAKVPVASWSSRFSNWMEAVTYPSTNRTPHVGRPGWKRKVDGETRCLPLPGIQLYRFITLQESKNIIRIIPSHLRGNTVGTVTLNTEGMFKIPTTWLLGGILLLTTLVVTLRALYASICNAMGYLKYCCSNLIVVPHSSCLNCILTVVAPL